MIRLFYLLYLHSFRGFEGSYRCFIHIPVLFSAWIVTAKTMASMVVIWIIRMTSQSNKPITLYKIMIKNKLIKKKFHCNLWSIILSLFFFPLSMPCFVWRTDLLSFYRSKHHHYQYDLKRFIQMKRYSILKPNPNW